MLVTPDLVQDAIQNSAQAAGDSEIQPAYVTQSKYFIPEFNAAIFDGPVRIYFTQSQEAHALKVYHRLQERFGEMRRSAGGAFSDRNRSIFVMLYPDHATFDCSFEKAVQVGQPAEEICDAKLGDDWVFGVRGPLDDMRIEGLYARMGKIVGA